MANPLTAPLLIKLSLLAGICIFLSTCSWPKVKIAGNEYLISPLSRESTVTMPNSTKGSGSDSKGIEPHRPAPQ